MRRENGRVLVGVIVLLAVVAAVEAVVLARVAGRVSELESRLAVAEAAGPVTPLALGGEVKTLAERVDGLEGKQERLREAVRAASGKIEEIEGAPALAATATADAGAKPEAATAANLEETVGKLVDEKLAKMPKGGGGEWKPSLAELGKELGLSEYQETQAKQVLDDAKHELYQLACRKRADGTAKIDDLVAAVSDPVDPEAAVKQWFVSLFSDKIPGRDEPYISEILRIKAATERSLLDALDADQGKRLKTLNVDYLGVKTGYDPFAEHIQSSFR